MAWPGPPDGPVIRSVDRLSDSRSGEWTAEQRSYVVTWQVITSEAVAGPISVMESVFATLFPIGSPYVSFREYDYFATLKTIGSAQPDSASRTRWIVTGRYDTVVKPGQRTGGPIEQTAKIAWDFGIYERVLTKDRDGNSIVNSAGQSPDPPIVETKRTLILRYTRNEPTYSPLIALNYIDRINQGAFLGGAAKTVKLNKFLGQQKHGPSVGTFGGGEYWEVEYEFEWNPDTWDEQVVDQGLLDKNGDHITTQSGFPVSSPVHLSNGLKKTPANPPLYLTIKKHKLADFSSLTITL